MFRSARWTLFACLTACAAQPAWAQLEEIVVTARKQQETLSSVPIAISAITADAIQQYNFRDFKDLQYVTPGLTYVEAGVGNNNSRATFAYVVRGMNVGASAGGAAATTLFIDGAPMLFGRLSTFTNVERIEVLKGPQTAYFGRNTFTGAINIVTKTPGDEWKARLSGEIGQYGSSDVDLSAEGPIIEGKLSVRAAGRQLIKGSQYTDNSLGRPMGGRRTTSGSITLHATPTDQLTLKLFAERSRLEDELGALFTFRSDFFNCNAVGGATRNWICGQLPSVDSIAARIGMPGVFDQVFFAKANPISLFEDRLVDHGGFGQNLFSLHGMGDYTFGNGIIFNSIVAYHENRQQELQEPSAIKLLTTSTFFPCLRAAGCERNFGQHAFQVESIGEDFSAEARLTSDQSDRLRWTIGGSYIYAEQIPGITFGETAGSLLQSFGNGNYAKSKTMAVFGGVYFDITEAFTANAEFRHQSDKVLRIPVDAAIGPGKPSTNPALRLENTFKADAPRVTLQYKLDPEVMIYTSWARGFRPGTFNAGILILPPIIVQDLAGSGATVAVDEEKLDQYELGVKGAAFNGRVRGSVTGYFGSLKGQQINQSYFFNRPEIGFFQSVAVITNSGKTKVRGVEVEAVAQPTEALIVDGSFAWNYTRIVTDACATCTRLGGTLSSSVGNRLENVPEFTGHLSGTYTVPVTGELDGYGRVEYFYQGSRYADRLNLASSGSTSRVNLRAGVKNETYSVEAYILNVGNDLTPDGLSLQNYFPEGLPGIKIGLPDKRQWGLRATYNW